MKQTDLLFLVISSFIVVIAWIAFNIYHNYSTSTIPSDVYEKIEPIPKEFDLRSVESIRRRLRIQPKYDLDVQTPIEEPSPTPSRTQTPTPPRISGEGNTSQ